MGSSLDINIPIDQENERLRAASFISKDQLMPHIDMHLRRGIRAAGGEDERLVATMEKIEPEMQVMDMEMSKSGDKDGLLGGGAATHPSSLQVILSALIFLIVLGV